MRYLLANAIPYLRYLASLVAYKWAAWRWTPHPRRYMDRGIPLDEYYRDRQPPRCPH